MAYAPQKQILSKLNDHSGIWNSFTRGLFQSDIYTAQKMKFFIKDFFSKHDLIRSFLRIGHIYSIYWRDSW